MTNLEDRYGRVRRPRRGRWIVGICAALVIALVWMVWVNFSVTSIETQDISHSYDEASQTMSITWSVSVAADTPVSCALQALNEQFQVVGWKVVDLPASADYSREFSDTIRTAMTPTSGLVYRCWAS